MNVQVPITSDNYTRDFRVLWAAQTKRVQQQALAPQSYVDAISLAREIRSASPDLNSRNNISKTLQNTHQIWAQGLKTVIQDLSLEDIATVLEHHFKFDLSFDNATFQAIDQCISQQASTTQTPTLIRLTHMMSHHSWVPSTPALQAIADHIDPDLIQTENSVLSIFLRTATLFDALGKTPSPLSPIAQYIIQEQLKALPTKGLRRNFANVNRHAAWHYNINALTSLIDIRPPAGTVSKNERHLKSLFAAHADVTPSSLLPRLGKHSDITLNINGQIIHIEVDGKHHFVHAGKPLYNGATLLNAALTARIYPDCVFVHIPQYEQRNAPHFVAALLDRLKQSKASQMRKKSPLMVLNRKDNVTLNPITNNGPYLRGQ